MSTIFVSNITDIGVNPESAKQRWFQKQVILIMHRNWLHTRINLLLLVILIGPVATIKLKHLILAKKLGQKWNPIRFTASKCHTVRCASRTTRFDFFGQWNPKMKKVSYEFRYLKIQNWSYAMLTTLYFSSMSKLVAELLFKNLWLFSDFNRKKCDFIWWRDLWIFNQGYKIRH